MQELIDNLVAKAGLSAEQAEKAITAVKDYVKEKFPMLEGAIENMLGKKDETKTEGTAPAGTGGVNDFVHNAEDKAGEVFDSLKDKISGIFGK